MRSRLLLLLLVKTAAGVRVSDCRASGKSGTCTVGVMMFKLVSQSVSQVLDGEDEDEEEEEEEIG